MQPRPDISFVAQAVDGIELRCAVCGIESEEQSDKGREQEQLGIDLEKNSL